ncbi:MAG: ABC transporter substrate-binding protein [Dehalococcoidia bacterium]|nr:ABC transporter substrate-binding protein [Dehalococcoidia bacterium]
MLGAGASALAAGAIAAACGSSDDDDEPGGETTRENATSTATAAAQPRKGGTLRMNQTADIVLNAGYPFVVAPQNSRLPWLIHEPLVRYRADVTAPELVLADRFEYNAARTALTVSIKPGATFHNGAPVTPEDVFFGIDFLLDPKQFGVTVAGVTTPLAKAITARKKLDERTMEFTFDRPRYDMTGFFTSLNVTQASTFSKLLTGEAVIGTGPYRFKSWSPGISYTLARNDAWHLSSQEGGPYLDEVVVTSFADEAAAATAFEAGELDIAFRLPGAEAKRFRDKVKTAPRIGGLILGMVVKNPMLTDPRVRQALFLAVDKERIAKELGEGFYSASSQIWPAYSPAHDPALDAPNYDPARARSLLKEAGFTQDRPLDIEYSQRSVANVTVVKENFEAAGVKTNLVPVDAAPLVTKLRNRQVTDFWASGTNLSDPVPASALLGNSNFSVTNIAYQENPELAAILGEMGAVDPLGPEAKQLYARFNRLWMDDPWVIPLEPSGALDVVSSKVRGFDEYFIQPLQAPNFGKVWLEA